MASDEKWVYTPWGYGKHSSSTPSHAIVHQTWGGIGYLSPRSVSLTIPISIKLFSAGRKALSFDWPLTQEFSLLYTMLQKDLSLPPNMHLSLYYPRGRLHPLLGADTPLKLKLPSGTKFIGIAKQVFTWDASKKSANIELLDDLLTVKKKDEAEAMFESVLGTVCMSTGLHEWEIKIDFLADYEEEEEIFIGVANNGIDLNKNPMEIEYWGIMCLACQKFGQGLQEDYGDRCGTGDVVGVALEFKDNKGVISFSRNGVSLGNAFCEVPPGVFPVVTLNYPKIQVSLGKSANM